MTGCQEKELSLLRTTTLSHFHFFVQQCEKKRELQPATSFSKDPFQFTTWISHGCEGGVRLRWRVLARKPEVQQATAKVCVGSPQGKLLMCSGVIYCRVEREKPCKCGLAEIPPAFVSICIIHSCVWNMAMIRFLRWQMSTAFKLNVQTLDDVGTLEQVVFEWIALPNYMLSFEITEE